MEATTTLDTAHGVLCEDQKLGPEGLVACVERKATTALCAGVRPQRDVGVRRTWLASLQTRVACPTGQTAPRLKAVLTGRSDKAFSVVLHLLVRAQRVAP